MEVFIGIVVVLVVACVLLLRRREGSKTVRNLADTQLVNLLALVLWPVLLFKLFGRQLAQMPCALAVGTVVTCYLACEITGFRRFEGALEDYDDCDRLGTRGVQISTLAFALGTLLLSQRNLPLAQVVSVPIFVALIFCTLAAVPSQASRSRAGASTAWFASQQAMTHYAAGLLAVSVGLCLDVVLRDRGNWGIQAFLAAESQTLDRE